MHIDIGSIKGRQGAPLTVRLSADNVSGLVWGEGMSQKAPVTVEAVVTNTGGCFLVRGKIQTQLEAQCNRCLRVFRLSLEAPLDEEFYREVGTEQVNLSEVGVQFAEKNIFFGDTIDLTEAVREQALLGLPYQVLCSIDCPGLCSVCGRELARGDCGCRSKGVDPRMEGLARLLSDWRSKDGDS